MTTTAKPLPATTVSLFEIFSHDGFNADGTSYGDKFLAEVWCESQTMADVIAKAFAASAGKSHVYAYFQLNGVVRPE